MKMNRVKLLLSLIAFPVLAQASRNTFSGAFDSDVKSVCDTLHIQLRNATVLASLSPGQEAVLLKDLKASDPEALRATLRIVKRHMHKESLRNAVLELIKDYSRQPACVKHEAIKTLSSGVNHSEVSSRLMEIGGGRSNDARLRTIAYKALYPEAAPNETVKGVLKDVAYREQDRDVRKGAIMGLFLSSRDPVIYKDLLYYVRNDSDVEIRDEALKSLYAAMGATEVLDPVKTLAANKFEEENIRYTAILMLAARRNVSKDTLTAISTEPNPRLSHAALVALTQGTNSREATEHFHTIWLDRNNVTVLDPIERENLDCETEP